MRREPPQDNALMINNGFVARQAKYLGGRTVITTAELNIPFFQAKKLLPPTSNLHVTLREAVDAYR